MPVPATSDIYVTTPEEVKALFPPSTENEVIIPIANATVCFGLMSMCWSRRLLIDEAVEVRLTKKVDPDRMELCIQEFDRRLKAQAPPWPRGQFWAGVVMLGWLMLAVYGYGVLERTYLKPDGDETSEANMPIPDAVIAFLLFLLIPIPMITILIGIGYYYPNKKDQQFEKSIEDECRSQNEKYFEQAGLKWDVGRQKIGCCKNDELYLKLEMLAGASGGILDEDGKDVLPLLSVV